MLDSTLSKFSDDNDSTEDASDNPSEIYSDSGSFEQSDIDSDAEQRDIEVVLPDFYAKDKKKTKTTNYKKRYGTPRLQYVIAKLVLISVFKSAT